MDYMYPDNLCESQNLFLFKECCAPEKIRGTSATGAVIVAMIEDVLREAEGEIENTSVRLLPRCSSGASVNYNPTVAP